MTDYEVLTKAIKRAENSGVTATQSGDVIVFLEKEIDSYRDKIERLEAYIDGKNTRIAGLTDQIEKQNTEITALRDFRNCVNSHYGFTQLEAVQDNAAGEIIKALSDNGYNVSINFFKNDESEV